MKISNARIQYYVEGQCEIKLVKTLIENKLIIPGQTDVLNPIQERVKSTHLRKLPRNTSIVLIFDTDQITTEILQTNISFLTSAPNIKRIITIPQVHNLEQELLRCTDIRHIRDLLNCTHDSDFKTSFIEEKRLFSKLQAHHFDIKKIWSSDPEPPYNKIGIRNQSHLIKLS